VTKSFAGKKKVYTFATRFKAKQDGCGREEEVLNEGVRMGIRADKNG
jgi:hypothetical protein